MLLLQWIASTDCFDTILLHALDRIKHFQVQDLVAENSVCQQNHDKFRWDSKFSLSPPPCYRKSLTVYPKKYAHAFAVLCFVVVMQSFIMNLHEVFIHIRQGCFAGTGAIVRLPQCQWSKPDGYGKISQCITTTKHSKAKTMCIFLGIYCKSQYLHVLRVGSECLRHVASGCTSNWHLSKTNMI